VEQERAWVISAPASRTFTGLFKSLRNPFSGHLIFTLLAIPDPMEGKLYRSYRKPQPCGFWNDPTRECRCTPLQIQRYVGRISGPLLDRIDIHVDVPAVRFRDLTGDPPPDAEDSAAIRRRVINARERQGKRLGSDGMFSNAAMTPRLIRRYCRIDSESETMLERAMARLGLSARAYDRILKVSRTIADLENSDEIQSAHVSEAVHYRSLDRTYWT
jgi:magnesium chelatase family protein